LQIKLKEVDSRRRSWRLILKLLFLVAIFLF